MTPYGRDLEPGVPPWRAVVDDMRFLSKRFGKKSLTWRYDPIILTDRYTRDLHLEWFAEVSALLETFVTEVVVSFVDIYPRMKKNLSRHQIYIFAGSKRDRSVVSPNSKSPRNEN